MSLKAKTISYNEMAWDGSFSACTVSAPTRHLIPARELSAVRLHVEGDEDRALVCASGEIQPSTMKMEHLSVPLERCNV